MHVRISTVAGAGDVDGVAAFVRDQALPQLQQQNGFRGLTVSGDRATGTVGVLSLWDSEADLHASDSVATKVRGEGLATFGGEATVETFEQVVAEVGPVPPGPGSRLRIVRLSMDPARVDDNVAFFREEVLPDIKATPGFQAVRNLVNRATGQAVVGTIWADDASLAAVEAQVEARRQRAAERGVEFGEISIREVLFSAL